MKKNEEMIKSIISYFDDYRKMFGNDVDVDEVSDIVMGIVRNQNLSLSSVNVYDTSYVLELDNGKERCFLNLMANGNISGTILGLGDFTYHKKNECIYVKVEGILFSLNLEGDIIKRSKLLNKKVKMPVFNLKEMITLYEITDKNLGKPEKVELFLSSIKSEEELEKEDKQLIKL